MNNTLNRHSREKREHPRYEFIQATFFRLDRDDALPHQCSVCNLSFGGLLMRCREEVELGVPILIVLNLDGLILKERLEIVHRSGLSDEDKNYGCRFLDDKNRAIRENEIKNFLEKN